MKPYAVVSFIKDGKTSDEFDSSEVPTCWLTTDFKQCWWPSTKNVWPLINKKVMPDKNNSKKWELHDIIFEGLYDDIQTARKRAEGLSSSDESSCCKTIKIANETKLEPLAMIKEETRTKKSNKIKIELHDTRKAQDFHSASDESSEDESGNIPEPPKLSAKAIMHRDLNLNTKGEQTLAMHNKTNNTYTVACNDDKANEEAKFGKPKVIAEIPVSINLKSATEYKDPSAGFDLQNSSMFLSSSNNSKNFPLPLDGSLNRYLIDNCKPSSSQIEDLKTLVSENHKKIADQIGLLVYEMRDLNERLTQIERVFNTNQLKASTRDNHEI